MSMPADDLLAEGLAHHAAGRFGPAAEYFRGLLAERPDHAAAWNHLGRALNNLRRPREALEAFERAVELLPDYAEAHQNRGHVLRILRCREAAAASLERALALDPRLPVAHINLGYLHLAGNRFDTAARHFEHAARLRRGDPAVLSALGVARHKAGEFERALAAYDEALRHAPDCAEAHANRAITLEETGRAGPAEEGYRRAVSLSPGEVNAWSNLGHLLIRQGRADEALACADACLSHVPGFCGAIAIRAIALYELGREAEGDELLSVDELVAVERPAAPAGWPDAAAFNRQLAGHVLEHPSLAYEPPGHATRNGRHTADLLLDPAPEASALRGMVQQAVESWLAGHAERADHPFLSRRPARRAMHMWSVVMHDQGHQLAHIHPAAWLSGVYYPRLPSVIDDRNRDGWLVFGEPPEDLNCRGRHPAHAIRPEEGLMILFPSYFYHRTVPFRSDDYRISIAFDIIPLD
ncbi:MAG: tetratricopeptide repeat protein [Gammaproteobacteria bacterium]